MTFKPDRPLHFTRRETLRVLGAGTAYGFGAILSEQLGFAQVPGWAAKRSSPRFPNGAIIRTVMKDVPPDALASGATMFHEHVTFRYLSPPPEPQRGGGGRGAAPAPASAAAG